MDGLSLKKGSGIQIHEMTVREAINYAYAHIVEDMREEDRAARMAGHNFEESLEDRIERFEEKIGLRPAHEDLALWMHKHVLLPARGYSEDEIAAMFSEEKEAALPPGVGEEDRWRFEDQEWDGLADFQGNPWDLPGLDNIRTSGIEFDKGKREGGERETLG